MLQLNNHDLLAIERELCARSPAAFLKRAWHVIEPGSAYLHNWHMDAIGEHLMACHMGQISRLLINVPPGTSKSTAVGVTYPAWLWGPAGDPSHRFIGASHDQDLAIRDNRKTRMLVESEWYQRLWPTQLTTDQNEKKYFENDKTGFRQAVAVKSMTGRRGKTVAWDDPHSPEKAYSEVERETAIRVFKETLPNRLVDPKTSVIMIIMQRLHEQDISGHILEHDYGYEHLCLPMEFEKGRCYSILAPKFMDAQPVKVKYSKTKSLWYEEGEHVPNEVEQDFKTRPYVTRYKCDPRTTEGELLFPDRFPREVVERDKNVMGDFAVAGQFQQRPSPRGGGMFPTERFVILNNRIHENKVAARVRYWDKAGSAGKGAWTVGVLMALLHDGRYVVENVVRDQLAALDREELIKAIADTDPAGTISYVEQEPGSGGKDSAEATVRNVAGSVMLIDRVTGDKVYRAGPYAAQVQAYNVMLYRDDWNFVFKEEHKSFPTGRYKDQVDAAAGAFMKLTNQGKRSGVLF